MCSRFRRKFGQSRPGFGHPLCLTPGQTHLRQHEDSTALNLQWALAGDGEMARDFVLNVAFFAWRAVTLEKVGMAPLGVVSQWGIEESCNTWVMSMRRPPKFGPESTKCAARSIEFAPISAQFGAISTRVGKMWATSAWNWSNLQRHRPDVAGFGQSERKVYTEFGLMSAKVGFRPEIGQIPPEYANSGRNGAEIGQSCLLVGRIRANLAETWCRDLAKFGRKRGEFDRSRNKFGRIRALVCLRGVAQAEVCKVSAVGGNFSGSLTIFARPGMCRAAAIKT